MFPNYKKTHPPAWLESSKWFRKFYALRRVLHYSAPPQFSDTDRFLKKLIEYDVLPSEGFSVDVGCFHPVKGNTTYVLYRRGWRGINIDVDPVKIEACNLRRPQDTNITCAVSLQAGNAFFLKKGYWSSLNSLEELKRAEKEGWRKMEVQTDTLTSLVDKTRYRNRQIDFLSVDVEGHDLIVLQSLDFDRYRPRVICVETWDTTLDGVIASELYRFLVSEGYRLINWVSLNLIFMHRDCSLMRLPS